MRAAVRIGHTTEIMHKKTLGKKAWGAGHAMETAAACAGLFQFCIH